MASNRNFVYFFRNLAKKHRLSLHDQHNESEVWYMFISPLKTIAMFIAVVLILFIIILTLVAYTPILSLIPGYSGGSQRETMIRNILRVDSIERKLSDIEEWSHDVSLIMEGKTPFMRDASQRGDSITITKPETIIQNREDSILRREMEGEGAYALSGSTARRATSDIELQTPVRGIVTVHFSPRNDSFGVGIATANNQQVMAVAEGTVISSMWLPESGYTIQIQHAANFISIYKNLSQSLFPRGSRVQKGEVIGYTSDGSDESGNRPFGLELWQNGTPLNPENYIIF